jgi:ParB-like chromosome segregation protein Spo0J
VIIAGHGRLLAARRLGLKTVPIIRVGHLTPEQVKAFRLADNKIHALAKEDAVAAALELKSLALELDPHLLDLTCYETAEIDALIENLEVGTASDPADDVPEPEVGRPFRGLAISSAWAATNSSVARLSTSTAIASFSTEFKLEL